MCFPLAGAQELPVAHQRSQPATHILITAQRIVQGLIVDSGIAFFSRSCVMPLKYCSAGSVCWRLLFRGLILGRRSYRTEIAIEVKMAASKICPLNLWHTWKHRPCEDHISVLHTDFEPRQRLVSTGPPKAFPRANLKQSTMHFALEELSVTSKHSAVLQWHSGTVNTNCGKVQWAIPLPPCPAPS